MATRNLVNRDKPSFKQQNLPAWQPILTASTVLPTFFLIGVAFVPIGIGLLMSSTTVQEKIIDYTDCKPVNSNITCADLLEKNRHQDCKCSLNFTLDEDFRKDVYVYYGLSNFYQNHRRYVKSRDDVQLLGNPKSASSDCYPFSHIEDPPGSKNYIPIAPCGAIANSIFNDTFDIFLDSKKLTLLKEGIAWSSDKNIRFRNPPTNNQDLKAAFAGTIKPPNWRVPVYELDSHHPNNRGFLNEDLIVWMRTAALPTFRKLYAIVSLENLQPGLSHLPQGEYELSINYNYPVKMFNGQKRFIISNTSWLGGKNNFLGIAYIVVGGICFIISAFFLFIHKKFGRLPSEIIQINQTTPYLAT